MLLRPSYCKNSLSFLHHFSGHTKLLTNSTKHSSPAKNIGPFYVECFHQIWKTDSLHSLRIADILIATETKLSCISLHVLENAKVLSNFQPLSRTMEVLFIYIIFKKDVNVTCECWNSILF